MDRGELFLHPVNRAEIPDYFEVVKEPMCWLFIDEKLEKNEYVTVADFQVSLILLESPLNGSSARRGSSAQ